MINPVKEANDSTSTHPNISVSFTKLTLIVLNLLPPEASIKFQQGILGKFSVNYFSNTRPAVKIARLFCFFQVFNIGELR